MFRLVSGESPRFVSGYYILFLENVTQWNHEIKK